MNVHHEFGKKAEEVACRYLQNKGYRLLHQNYRTRLGEIDLIFERSNAIIFVEVKALTCHRAFSPEDHFDWKKQRKQRQLALAYLANQRVPVSARCDLIAVTKKDGEFFIEHYEDVIQDS